MFHERFLSLRAHPATPEVARMSQRTFTVHTSTGEPLEFRSLEGSEHISRLFEYRVKLLSPSATVAARHLLGTDLGIEIDLTTQAAGSAQRYLSGQVTQFSYTGRDGDYYIQLRRCSAPLAMARHAALGLQDIPVQEGPRHHQGGPRTVRIRHRRQAFRQLPHLGLHGPVR